MAAQPGSNVSHLYEVSLSGSFFARDLKPILNRITLHSEGAEKMHTREILFEPMDSQIQRDTFGEPVILRATKELDSEGPKKEKGWILYSYLKPESVRAHPEATVRPWATMQVVGDALSFASALGYLRRSQIYRSGYTFRRKGLIIQMFQQEQVDPKTQKPIPVHADTLWEVQVKNATPVKNAQAVIEQVLEVQLLMKGLLDLRRQDV